MAFKTTLFEAATTAHHVQLDGQDVLRPVRIRDGEIRCSRGQDDWWVISDQEIDVDDSGAALVQVREECAHESEMLTMRFSMSRPLMKDDLIAVGFALDGKLDL